MAVLELHQGGRSTEAVAEATRKAAEALAELSELMDGTDSLKRPCSLMALVLQGRSYLRR